MPPFHFGLGDQIILILLFSSIALDIFPAIISTFYTFILLSLWLSFHIWKKQHWKRMGVPQAPGAHFLLGHTFGKTKFGGTIEFERVNFDKCGKSFGLFVFDRHEFYTLDRDLLGRIFFTEFEYFRNRFFSPFLLPNQKDVWPNSLYRNIVHLKWDDEWRRVRAKLIPAFTTGKLKKLYPVLCAKTIQMCEHIREEYIPECKLIPLKSLSERLILAELCQALFSIELDTFVEEGHGHGQEEFVEHIRNHSAKINIPYSLRAILFFCPGIVHLLEKYFHVDFFTNNSHQFFHKLIEGIFEQRKLSASTPADEKNEDIFQFLLDENQENISNKKLSKNLSKIELFSNAFILLTSGLETTSSTLHFAIYLLAIHIKVQEKVRCEIGQISGTGTQQETVTFEQLKQMAYLGAVLKETLRLFPPAPTRHHECSEGIAIGGIKFQKGDIIALPIYAIQHNPEFHSEPEEFRPERFLCGNADPIGFAAFGLGPRSCIGRRLAEMQIQLALCQLIRQFRFKPSPTTPQFPLEFVPSLNFLKPKKPLNVLAELL